MIPLPKNGGIFQLSITDLFKTVKYKNYYGALTPDPFDGHSWDVYNPESRQSPIINLTYTRSFGTASGKSQRTPDTGSREERDRIRKTENRKGSVVKRPKARRKKPLDQSHSGNRFQ